MSVLGPLIQGALLQKDRQLQRESESRLFVLLEENPTLFFVELVRLLTNEAEELSMRQSSGAVFKRCAKWAKGGVATWLTVGEEVRREIKEKLVSCLTNENKQVRRSVSDCISVICGLEFRSGGWPTLIPALVQNCSNENAIFRNSAVLTLGFVCEQLKLEEVCVDERTQEVILSGVLIGLKAAEDQEIRTVSMTAFRDSVSFYTHLFPKPDVRKYLLSLVCEVIAKPSDEDIRRLAFEAIIEVSKSYYVYLGDSVQDILKTIVPFIESTSPEDESSCVLAIEVLSNIASEYHDLALAKKEAPNYLAEVEVNIVQLLLQKLLLFEEGEEDDFNSVASSAQNSLLTFAEIGTKKGLELVKLFVTNTIGSPDWKLRRAGLIGFACMLEYPDSAEVEALAASGLHTVHLLLADKSQSVRIAAAKTISRLTESFPDCYFCDPKLYTIFVDLVGSLEGISRTMVNVCRSVCNLYKARKHPHLESMAGKVISLAWENAKVAANQKELRYLDTCWMTAYCVLINTENLNLPEEHAFRFLGQLEQVKSKPTLQNEIAYISGLKQCILAYCLVVQKSKAPSKPDLLEAIYLSTIRLFKLEGDVSVEGLLTLGSLASILKDKIKSQVPEIWPFVQHGLNKVHEVDVFKAAMSTMGDLARAVGKDFKALLPKFIAITQFVSDQNFNRQGKISILVAIGDIALSCKNELAPELARVVEVIHIGVNASVELTVSGKDQEFCDQLKEAILDSFIFLLHGMCEQQPSNELFGSLGFMVEFVKFCNQAKFNPTVQFVECSLYLLADLLRIYQRRVKSYFGLELVEGIKGLLANSSRKQSLADAIRTVDSFLHYLK